MQFETIPNSETWLVCGGRFYEDVGHIHRTLTNLTWVRGNPLQVVQGGAIGADWAARQWAERWVGGRSFTEYAEWEKYGKAAGPIRNQLMLDKFKPDLVIAFPGGTGTANMIIKAKKAGVKIITVKEGD